ncbi:MAG: nucleotide exchange factor GrpE [Acidimicrobiia bacterium]|mgnify:CR=1 FL=1
MSNIEEDNKNLNEPEDQFVNYSFDDDEPVSGGTYTLDDIENLDGIDGEATYIDSDDDVDESSTSSLPDSTNLFGSDISSIQAERDSYLDTLRQIQADFENYKKRVIRDQNEFSDLKTIAIMGELLGVLDNFELALNSFNDGEADEKILKLKKGIDLVYSDFYSALEKQGLERIEAKGKAFDPEIHEAVMHDNNGDNDVEIVVEVLRPGYLVKGKVIRPAMVKVSK